MRYLTLFYVPFFTLIGFLGYWIMYPVLVGIAFEVMALYFNDFNRPELPAFAFFIAIWMITMVRYWQRVQVILWCCLSV